MAAIEEYQEVSERYLFMQEQVGDVEKSREELLKLIRDLTQNMRSLFVARFEEINNHFGATFQELFGGGGAQLKLSDPDDILNSGIRHYVSSRKNCQSFGASFRRRKRPWSLSVSTSPL